MSWTSSPQAVAPVPGALQVGRLCQLPLLQELPPQLRSLPVEELPVLRARLTSAQELLELMALRGPRCPMQLLLALREPQLRRAQELLEGALLLEGEVVVQRALSLVREVLVPLREPLLALLQRVVLQPLLALLLTLREQKLRDLRLAAKCLAAGENAAALRRRIATTTTSHCTENPRKRAPLSFWGSQRRNCGSVCSRPPWCRT